MPYAVRTSPHIDESRRYAVGWARDMGMFDDGVWDERRFVGFDFAHCAAMIHADASRDQLNLTSDWLAWGTYGDDYFPLVFGAARNIPAAKLCNERLSLFMPLDGGATPDPTNPIERGLRDLWRRTAGPMAVGARQEFRKAVEDMTESWVWEVFNQAQHRVPDPVDYIEMRRRTFGSDMTMSLNRLAHWSSVPREIYQTSVVREMETAAQDYACFTNDLFSYQKEVEYEGEVHNIVLVVENFLEVDRITARDVVAKLMTARMEQFGQIVENDLPAMFEDLDLDEEVRAILTRHADGLKEWMSGILEWHRKCVRYVEAELKRTRASAVPDLGTSALRVRGASAPGVFGVGRPGLAVSGAGLPGALRPGAPAGGPPVGAVPSTPVGAVPSGPAVTTPSAPVGAVPSGPAVTTPSAPVGAVPSGPVVTGPSTDVPSSGGPVVATVSAPEGKRAIGVPTGLGTSAVRVRPQEPKVSAR